ncbi:MAG: amidohydrolase family protein [Armatimonadetes bacterium]|nr:amidohydrolase family protein [Armatimonadota bacterium]
MLPKYELHRIASEEPTAGLWLVRQNSTPFMRRILLLALLLFTLTGAAGDRYPVHAFKNARVIVAPGRVIEKGILVVRDGRVEAVGAALEIPADARVHDLSGKTIHAGFIDPYVTVGRLEGRKVKKPLAFSWEDEEEEEEAPEPKEKPPAFKPSVVSSENPRVHPDWRASAHLVPRGKVIKDLRAEGFVLVQAVPDRGVFRGQAAVYSLGDDPRKALIADDTASVAGFETLSWNDRDFTYPASMMGNAAVIRQAFADARWYRDARRADAASYQGRRRPATQDALAALAPVIDGRQTLLFEANTLLDLRRAEKLLDEAGVQRRALVLSGEEWRRPDWVPNASLILPLDFPAKPKAKSDGEWIDVDTLTLKRWRYAPGEPRWLNADGKRFSLTTHRLGEVKDFQPAVRKAIAAGLDEEAALAALTVIPAQTLGLADRFGTLEPGKAASFVVRGGGLFEDNVEEVWIEGEPHAKPVDDEDDDRAPAKKDVKAGDYAQPPAVGTGPKAQTVLVRDATVWTEGPQGRMLGADLLVQDGRVKAVGPNLNAPAGALIIDGRGLHVTPGLIDAHSHTAVDGDVNEGAAAVTAQVTILDVLNPFDEDIYRQLAGGVTAANVMHGSANAIGGQVVTCKWKWGGSPQDLVMSGAPGGIKFALGENPRQANWGSGKRYPNTRMGVAELIRERFAAAREYRKRQEDFRAGRITAPPRPDHQLDVLLEFIDGKRLIQCHSYRQDEILALIRIAEEEGFKIKTFQHVLEGYKVADEIAKHGAMASTFSDWWAYKVEVMDAIPYNGALMHERAVVVSFNSDSNDLARRLNTEAAKAVRYGGLSETDALKFVTINAAKQLGVEQRIGSLEPGKDGDFVIWSANPLSQDAVVLQTWIEGRRYFDRVEDAERREQAAAERAALVKLARGKGKK